MLVIAIPHFFLDFLSMLSLELLPVLGLVNCDLVVSCLLAVTARPQFGLFTCAAHFNLRDLKRYFFIKLVPLRTRRI